MSGPTKILIATPNDGLFCAFKTTFQRFDVDLIQMETYSEVVEKIQDKSCDLIISDYFLKGSGDDETYDVFDWEIQTIENDMKIVGVFREPLMWLRNLITEKGKQKIFPLGRRLSIEADLIPIRNIFLSPYMAEFEDETADIADYFALYRYNMFYIPTMDLQKVAYTVVGYIIKKQFVNLQKVF